MSIPIPPRRGSFSTPAACEQATNNPSDCSTLITDLVCNELNIQKMAEAILLYQTAKNKLTWSELGTSVNSGEYNKSCQEQALKSLKQGADQLDLENSNPELYKKLESFFLKKNKTENSIKN